MSNTLNTITSTTTRQPVLPVASEKVTGPNLLAATFGGKVRFSKVRSNGTLRSWPVLAPKTEDRKKAEALAAAVAKSSVAAVAKEQHVSAATVRRTLVSLEFTLELEGLTATAKASIAKAATANLSAKPEAPKAEQAKPEPKAEVKAPAKKTTAKATPAKPVGKVTAAKQHAAKMAKEADATVAAAKAASTTK